MMCPCGKECESYGDEHLCTQCFVERFEKRVKKALRIRMLKKGERVLVVGEVAAYLFKKFISLPLIVEFSPEIKSGFDAAIIEWTLDDECVSFLEAFAGGLELRNEYIKLFQFLSDKDVEIYAGIHGLFFVPRTKNMHWQEFLNGFGRDMKYNLLRSSHEMLGVTFIYSHPLSQIKKG